MTFAREIRLKKKPVGLPPAAEEYGNRGGKTVQS